MAFVWSGPQNFDLLCKLGANVGLLHKFIYCGCSSAEELFKILKCCHKIAQSTLFADGNHLTKIVEQKFVLVQTVMQ